MVFRALQGLERRRLKGVTRLRRALPARARLFDERGTPAVIDFTTPATILASGIPIYQKTVFASFFTIVMYITMSMTGDGHNGAAHLFQCLLDGVLCNGGTTFAGAPGWINLQRHGAEQEVYVGGGEPGGPNCDGCPVEVIIPADEFHDNVIHYTWCVATTGGPHTVEIRMASSGEGSVVIEGAHFFVDSNWVWGTNRCTQAPEPVDNG